MGIFDADGRLARFLNALGNLIVLNILTLICSLPIITIGTSMTALYTMTMRMARNEESSIIRGYFRAFHNNFKQSTIFWGIGGGLIVFMLFDIWLLQSVKGNFGLELIHIFAVQARFENTMKNTAKNALLFCVGHFPQAILMLTVTLLPVILLSVSYRFISVNFLIGISGPAYLAGWYFKSIFKAYENEEETIL